ncbi:hypothetical protein KFE25_009710 [Diacronema lutheri]|uniref:JmjC domain-containing protein n=2 Tax=Diacronema lutheri TaxID=2081491 RepID=A0A8J5Y6G4_DIALT|nr:hypothetical protein KFE25_009710 [Diacronema lutheri]
MSALAARVDGRALRTAADFAHVRALARPCVLVGVEWPALAATGWLGDWAAAEAALVARRARVACRAPARVARSGGAFAPSEPARALGAFAAEARARAAPLAFSTAHHDELARVLRGVLSAPPPALRAAASQPIVSLGGGGAGLDFHRHDESWLWLVCGRKHWAFAPPDTPADVLQSAPPRGASPSLSVEQLPAELVYVPGGWWHATVNATDVPGLTFGLGGLGVSPGLHFDAARGDVAAIAAAPPVRALAAAADGLPCSLAHTAARHAQPAVLRALAALERAAGAPGGLLGAPDGGALGATPLHWAAGAAGGRARAAVRLLLAQAPGTLRAFDRTGATPLHWVARGGDTAVACALLDAGADACAADARGVTPLHLACAEGHARLVRCLARVARARVGARDADGRTPLDWAEACGTADAVRDALLREPRR